VSARLWLLPALAATLLRPAPAQIAILQIRFIEGEGAVHPPGSRIPRALTIEVTDEVGAPVAGAAVSFHLPEDGPGGTLANGLRTDVGITDTNGRVSLRGMRVNRIPGRFQIRIVASKEQARAGVISSQYIAEPGSGAATSKSRTKWIVIAAVAAGGAAAGIWSAGRGTAAPSAAPPASPPPSAVTIGPPTTSVGKP
jgi:hypothetical protein